MKIQNTRILLPLLTACLTIPTIPTRTVVQTPPESPVFPQEEPEVILKKACDTLSSKQAFTVDVDVTYDNVLDSGDKVQYSAFQQLWVKRPDHLKADYTGDERQTTFYYDGKTFTLLAKKFNLFTTKPAPPTLDAAIAGIEEKYDITIPLSNLLVSNPCKKITPLIRQAAYVGFDLVNRVPSYHFLFIGEDRSFQVWISDDDEPVPQKIVITYKNLPGAPQYTAVLSNWNFNPQISTNTFKFTPPSGARQIEILPMAAPDK